VHAPPHAPPVPVPRQSVLRTVLPRLDTVKVLRKGVAEVPPGAPQPEPPHAAPAKGKKGAAQADAMAAAALPPAVAAVLATQSVGGGRTAFGAAIDDVRAALEKGTSAGASKRPPSSSSAALSSSSTQLAAPAAPAGRRARGPNKDALFLVTADPRPALEAVLEAAVLMETHEVPVPRNSCRCFGSPLICLLSFVFAGAHAVCAAQVGGAEGAGRGLLRVHAPGGPARAQRQRALRPHHRQQQGALSLYIVSSPYLIPQLGPYLNPYLNANNKVRSARALPAQALISTCFFTWPEASPSLPRRPTAPQYCPHSDHHTHVTVIATFLQALREANQKKKEASAAKVEQARQKCRQENMAKVRTTLEKGLRSHYAVTSSPLPA